MGDAKVVGDEKVILAAAIIEMTKVRNTLDLMETAGYPAAFAMIGQCERHIDMLTEQWQILTGITFFNMSRADVIQEARRHHEETAGRLHELLTALKETDE